MYIAKKQFWSYLLLSTILGGLMQNRSILIRLVTIAVSFILFAILYGIGGSIPSFAQTDTCTSSSCHTSMGRAQSVHPPVKEGMCTACHLATAEAAKKTKHPGNLSITLIQEGADLCYQCHEPKNKKKTIHAPVMAGDCITCHDPHQSQNKGMLKQAGARLCFQCHPDSIIAKQKVIHPPVASEDCSGCHDNHESDFAARLVQDPKTLCFNCHPDKEEGLKASNKVVHYPVKDSCLTCHNPHGSQNKAMLSSAMPDLCSNCHPNEVSFGFKSVTMHSPVVDGRMCLNCHDPHFADHKALLPKAQMELCLGCHDKDITTKTGRIMDMKSYLDANKNAHGPLRKKDCVSCHGPHGSNYWRMLVKYYPGVFYTAYSDGKYALCFSCHNKAAFTDRLTKTSTGFRNGNKNLHFVHVNKIDKGRTCRACHEVHADTGSPKHVRDKIGFGYWTMPMNFQATKNGGSCAPGCHGEKTYAR